MSVLEVKSGIWTGNKTMGLRTMIAALMGLVGVIAVAPSADAETVAIDVASQSGTPISLPAEFSRPEGDGPFAAVVLLHGCGGIWKLRDGAWVERLVSWGYVVLQPDSYGPRGFTDGICENIPAVSVLDRVADAHAAKDYLADLPYVDADRIAVMGMSHGGWTTLAAVENTYLSDAVRTKPFKAAVALYPHCDPMLYRLDAPLLILIGDADDWTYAYRCERMELKDPIGHAVTLKVYPGATHAFDADWPGGVFFGHSMKFDPDAARDAVTRVQAFLARHLSNG